MRPLVAMVEAVLGAKAQLWARNPDETNHHLENLLLQWLPTIHQKDSLLECGHQSFNFVLTEF